MAGGVFAEEMKSWAKQSRFWDVDTGPSEEPADAAEWDNIFQEAGTLPGPWVPNMWYWAPLTPTYSRWQFSNGGTRTFQAPLGHRQYSMRS